MNLQWIGEILQKALLWGSQHKAKQIVYTVCGPFVFHWQVSKFSGIC